MSWRTRIEAHIPSPLLYGACRSVCAVRGHCWGQHFRDLGLAAADEIPWCRRCGTDWVDETFYRPGWWERLLLAVMQGPVKLLRRKR